MSHLQNALDELLAEQENLAQQQKRLAARVNIVQQGIDSLSQLLSDSEASNPAPGSTPIENSAQPLWQRIEWILRLAGPCRPKEIADTLLAEGYSTTSKDFGNVVGTNLRAFPDKFRKLEDGRWEATSGDKPS